MAKLRNLSHEGMRCVRYANNVSSYRTVTNTKRLYSSISDNNNFDLIIVGGGILGTASAREVLKRNPHLKVALLEKENCHAKHQTGNNSGVIHAGIYYKPGSLKARLCVRGMKLIYEYCDSKNIPYKKCGKLIVATNPIEVVRLNDLIQRGIENNVPDMRVVDRNGINEIEPHCVGIKAIHSPHTGIVDYVRVTESYADDFKNSGGIIHFSFSVESFQYNSDNVDYPVRVASHTHDLNTKYVLTCCGLQSDIMAMKTGCSPNPIIVPFRGEYLVLNPEKRHLINGNIYPVPDPRFPFLGVHFTPRMDGSVILGPNAVLALKKEGYRWSDANLSEFYNVLKHPGFRKLAMKYAAFGLSETIRSIMPALQIKQLQKFIPDISSADVKSGLAGVRAQAMFEDGSLVDDFVFDSSGTFGNRVLHCRNAPSPGATSSLAIAELIADKLADQFNIYK